MSISEKTIELYKIELENYYKYKLLFIVQNLGLDCFLYLEVKKVRNWFENIPLFKATK